jgi:hypothetical protein
MNPCGYPALFLPDIQYRYRSTINQPSYTIFFPFRVAEENSKLGFLNRRFGVPLIDGATVRYSTVPILLFIYFEILIGLLHFRTYRCVIIVS